ncbi:helix-turn-helix domain-containing protein [Synechococcus sp. TAK9802]|uniref:helix-turn-helix domain-containing protein n=1 Tax=Synechococcus sp. TAK9802 TaxID=1442558 RepID=UPI0016450A80|nr:helix-turn-helix domain-containing protein [Synechococcus sp. TAK9802]QNI61364.1 transcriptional regulator/ Crp/Fnr family [Synechococcus sp. TAK9802]
MNTENQHRKKGGRSISLNSHETIRLERPQAGEIAEITVKSGVIRIAGEQSNNAKDITLAFACRADAFKFHYPEDLEITVEAITDTTYIVESIEKKGSDTSDAIMEWIIQLHIVRHETNIENRLMKFFRLLITKLGKRTSEGLLLENTLPHARIAEIIGSTRSTVSRTISTLRKSQQIYIDELKGQILLPVD